MGVGTLLHAVSRRPLRFRRLALVIPPTAWATPDRAGGRLPADGTDRRRSAATTRLVRAMGAFAPLPLLEEGGWTTAPPPDIDPSVLPDGVPRGGGHRLPGARRDRRDPAPHAARALGRRPRSSRSRRPSGCTSCCRSRRCRCCAPRTSCAALGARIAALPRLTGAQRSDARGAAATTARRRLRQRRGERRVVAGGGHQRAVHRGEVRRHDVEQQVAARLDELHARCPGVHGFTAAAPPTSSDITTPSKPSCPRSRPARCGRRTGQARPGRSGEYSALDIITNPRAGIDAGARTSCSRDRVARRHRVDHVRRGCPCCRHAAEAREVLDGRVDAGVAACRARTAATWRAGRGRIGGVLPARGRRRAGCRADSRRRARRPPARGRGETPACGELRRPSAPRRRGSLRRAVPLVRPRWGWRRSPDRSAPAPAPPS